MALRAMVITTKAKAETSEKVPEFVEKFENFKNEQELVDKLQKQGYKFCLIVHPGRVTVGDLWNEYRLLGAALFFKTEPPPFEVVAAGKFRELVVVIEHRKHYSQMSSIGKSYAYGKLRQKTLAAWFDFFEVKADPKARLRPIEQFHDAYYHPYKFA